MGDTLYVGGEFTQLGRLTATGLNNIARYNLTTKTWSALAHNGLNDKVEAIAFVGTDMYVVGYFDGTNQGTPLNFIGKYDTVNNSWAALPEDGLNVSANALAVYGQSLYVGGGFTGTNGGTANLNYIARYRTDTETWGSLTGHGLNGSVYSLLVMGNYLYVGGAFTQSDDGTTTGLNNIARYGLLAISVSPLEVNGLNNAVFSLASVGNDVYVGGMFTQNNSGTIPLVILLSTTLLGIHFPPFQTTHLMIGYLH